MIRRRHSEPAPAIPASADGSIESFSVQHLLEFSPAEGSKDEYAPLGELLPPKVMETVKQRISAGTGIAIQFVQGLIERDETQPKEDYVCQLLEEGKEEHRQYREKHKPS